VGDAALATMRFEVILGGKGLGGWIDVRGRTMQIDALEGFYLRPGKVGSDASVKASTALLGIASCTDAIVVNRPSAGRSNGSKPFQLRLIAEAGFAVPSTLVTTDPEAARAFLVEHGRIVYKSVSGVRSIVATLRPTDAGRLASVANGPVQFQRWIDGTDVRVHVVGDRWFATEVRSEAEDYRYAARDGLVVVMESTEIPPTLGERLVGLTRRMGLIVSGIDLRRTDRGEWVCLEVNPSPGFTAYEDATGQPIGEAIADLIVRSGLGLAPLP